MRFLSYLTVHIYISAAAVLLLGCAGKGSGRTTGGGGATSGDDLTMANALVTSDKARFFISIPSTDKWSVNTTPLETTEYSWIVEAELSDTRYQFGTSYISKGEVNEAKLSFADLMVGAKAQINVVRLYNSGEEYLARYGGSDVKARAAAGGVVIELGDDKLMDLFHQEKPQTVKFITTGAKQKAGPPKIINVDYK